MGRQVPVAIIPKSADVPAGIYRVQIEEVVETQTQEKGYLMYKLRMEVLEPAEMAGRVLFDNIVIGNENDPDATNHATWRSGMSAPRLKQIWDATGIDVSSGDIEVMHAQLIDQLCMAVLRSRFDKRKQETVVNIRQYLADGANDAAIEEHEAHTPTVPPPAAVKRKSTPKKAAAKKVVEQAKPLAPTAQQAAAAAYPNAANGTEDIDAEIASLLARKAAIGPGSETAPAEAVATDDEPEDE
jgi:hypothetical protein